jgi:hypothetical protein
LSGFESYLDATGEGLGKGISRGAGGADDVAFWRAMRCVPRNEPSWAIHLVLLVVNASRRRGCAAEGVGVQLVLVDAREIATGVRLLTLASADGQLLPQWMPGRLDLAAIVADLPVHHEGTCGACETGVVQGRLGTLVTSAPYYFGTLIVAIWWSESQRLRARFSSETVTWLALVSMPRFEKAVTMTAADTTWQTSDALCPPELPEE